MKYRILLLVLFFFVTFPAHSDNIDSLKNLLKTPVSDVNRASVLNQLAEASYYNNAAAARDYAQEALGLANKINDNNGQLESHFQLATAYYFLSLYKNAIQTAQHCLALCAHLGNTKREADVYYVKGRAHFAIGEIKEAEACYEICKNISEKAHYREGIGKAAKGIGDIFDTKGDFTKALENYDLHLKISLEDNYKIGQMVSYNDHGRICEYTGKTDEGLKNYLQSLKIAEEIGNFYGVGAASNNISILYSVQKDYKKALEYTFKSLENNQKINNLKGMAYNYHDIAHVMKNNNSLDTALIYYQKALDIRTTLGDKRGLSFTYFGMGDLYKKKKDWLKARQYHEKSLAIREGLGYKMGISASCTALGTLLMESGDYPTALLYLKKALQIAQEVKGTEELYLTYKSLALCHEKMGDFRNAFSFQTLALSYQDSLFNTDHNKQFAQMQTQYETEKKEKQILKQDNDILALEQSKSRMTSQRNFVLGGLLASGILGFFGFQFYKMKKDRNDKMAFAEALIYAQEEERKRIARDLHDGVGQSLLLIRKQMETTHETTLDNQRMITETLEEVRSISRDLHPFQLEKLGLTAAINEVIHKIEHSTELFITKEMDNIDGMLSDKAQIHVFRTIQEALNNVMKHSEATAAKVSIKSLPNEIIITVQDNGKGFDLEWAVVKSKSLGLRTMNERIASLGGKLKITPNQPKGTIIELNIPKKT